MSDSFLLDCSVTMTWCFADEATNFSRKVMHDLETKTAFVPSLWALEVTNVLLIGEKKKRVTRAQSSRFLSILETLPINIEYGPESIGETSAILQIARDFELTVYDATYLELAVRKAIPIATLDKSMKLAAKRIGIAVYE